MLSKTIVNRLSRRSFLTGTAGALGLGMLPSWGRSLLAVGNEPVNLAESGDRSLSGRGAFAEPLHENPSPPGPHIDRIKAMRPGEWLQLEPPAPDPEWGAAAGRSWGAYAFAYAPNIGGAFFCGEGKHGGWGATNPAWDEDHPQYWYGLDDYWFLDIMQNRWICIYPGTPIKDLHTEFTSGRWVIDPTLEQVVIDTPEPTLPRWLQGSIAPVHMLVHAWGFVGYDCERDRLFHFGQNSRWLRGFRSYFFPGGSSSRTTGEARDWLDARGYFDDTSDPPLGPVVYDAAAGRFLREPVNFESYGRGFPNYVYIPRKDEAFRVGTVTAPRFFDFGTHTWGSGLASSPVSDGYDVPMCYDSKRNRIYVGIGAGQSDVSVQGHFRYYDIDTDTWVFPEPPGANEPPGSSWGNNVAHMAYDSVADQVLLFHMHSSWSAEAQRIFIYDIERNAWADPVTAPAGLMDGRGNRLLHMFYAASLNAYFILRSRDSRDDHVLYVYKHSEAGRDGR